MESLSRWESIGGRLDATWHISEKAQDTEYCDGPAETSRPFLFAQYGIVWYLRNRTEKRLTEEG
jgi:hypothetical protein